MVALLALGAWSLASLVAEGYWSWQLARHGVAVTATVQDYQPQRVRNGSGRHGPTRTYVFHMHRVRLCDHRDRVETVQLRGKHSVGAEVAVLYLANRDGIAVAGSRDDSVVAIFFNRIHGHKFLWLMLWIKLIVGGIFALFDRLFPDQVNENVSSAILDAAVQSTVGVQSE
jgi:hypothetical protein